MIEVNPLLLTGAVIGTITALLTAGNSHTPFSQDGFIALFKVHDIIPHVRQRRRTVDLIESCIVHAKADIVCNGI